MTHSNSSEGEPESPLPTPSHDVQSDSLFASLQSFSFGGSCVPSSSPPALSFSIPDSSAFPPRHAQSLSLSSFPSYCFPDSNRRRSSAKPDLDDLEEGTDPTGGLAFSFARLGRVDRDEDDQDMVNPSPVYGKIDEDGFTIQPLGTPIAERERFEYPDFSSADSSGSQQPVQPTRPEAQPDQSRRGSISLPNVLTTSGILAPPFAPPASLFSPSVPDPLAPPPILHPANSPFYSPRQSFSLKNAPARRNSSRNNSLIPPNASSSSGNSPAHPPPMHSPRQSISRSISVSGRPQLPPSHPSFGRPNSGSMSHIHPPHVPFSRFQPAVTSGPIPPSLRSHPALSSSTSGPAISNHATSSPNSSFTRPSPTLPTNSPFAFSSRRRESLPSISPPPSLHAFKRASESNASVGPAIGRRRGSDAGVGLGIRKGRAGGSSAISSGEEDERPRLGSIPSFGSDESETATTPTAVA